MKARTKRRLPMGFTERENGSLMYRFTVNGRRITVYGSTIKECRIKEAEKIQEIEEQSYKPGKEQTFEQYADQWQDMKAGAVLESTIRSNRVMLNAIIRAPIDAAGNTFGSLKMSDIEAQNVRALQKELAKSRSTRTVNDSISMVRGIFNAAIAERILLWNPAQGIRALKRTEERAADTIHRALTRQETTIFLNAAKESNAWNYNLYVFLLNTGLRIGEAAALTNGDIVDDEIIVRRTVTRSECGAYKIGSDTKTAAGRRSVPLNAEARKALEDQKAIERLVRNEKVTNIRTPIFRAERGGLLHATLVNYNITKLCRETGIERFTVHAFRDTFATRCIESGMHVKTLQVIMGHTDINMTLALYAHCMKETRREQLEAVNFI